MPMSFVNLDSHAYILSYIHAYLVLLDFPVGPRLPNFLFLQMGLVAPQPQVPGCLLDLRYQVHHQVLGLHGFLSVLEAPGNTMVKTFQSGSWSSKLVNSIQKRTRFPLAPGGPL